MQFGIMLPHASDDTSPESLAAVARAAEEMGFSSLWVADHIVVPDTPEYISRRNFFEPLTVLSYMAAITQRIRLGTSILVLPYRNPIVTAKIIATLDVLSQARLILGVGPGGVEPEFKALGVKKNERGKLTDEYLDIMKTLWREEKPSFHGRYHNFDDIRFEPKPKQTPHPPIWVGGNRLAAIRRAVEQGDGWNPVRKPIAELRQDVDTLHRLAQDKGRDGQLTVALTTGLRLSESDLPQEGRVSLQGSLAQVIEDLHGYARIGVSHIILNFGSDALETLKSMERLAELVLPHMTEALSNEAKA